MLQRERCLHGRGGVLDGDAAAVEFGNELDRPLGEGRLQPDQLGVAASQPGGIDAHYVLEAPHGQVVALPMPRCRRPVRRLCPVDQRQVLKRGQDAVHGRHCGAGNELSHARGRGTVFGVRVGAQMKRLQHLHLGSVKTLQGALDADPGAGPCRQRRKIRDRGRQQVRPRRKEGPQRVIAACLQLFAERADKGHQSNVTARRTFPPGACRPRCPGPGRASAGRQRAVRIKRWT